MPGKTKIARSASAKRKWSAEVTRNSHALDLKQNVFNLTSAKKIAESLKNSAAKSNHKKGTPYQSAMSMLNFYINRAGKNLSAAQKKRLELAKTKLKESFQKKAPNKSKTQ
ncbi:MAG TPA: DUF3175 domain-containing protein [Puia sp.]|nr:DUF3175 domain-containing protein [Puia sp.]